MAHAHIEEFNTKDRRHSGGKTGSTTVKKGEDNYQLKPSILDAKLERKLKARYSDNENFADCIASKVLESVTASNQEGAPELIAQGSLVLDTDNKRILFASRHIKNLAEGATLEGYAISQNPELDVHKGAHVRISTEASGEDKDVFYMGGDDPTKKQLRKDLAKAIACSMLTGDHDVNPGNMMAFKDKDGAIRIARIDFGHAFNDLLAGPKIFGGRVRNRGNIVLDFMNRDTLLHLSPNNQQTKLWRDYVGLIPSSELAEAMHEVSAEGEKCKEGVKAAYAHFSDVLEELEKDPKGNKELIEHIMKSLISINNNVSSNRIYLTTPTEDVLIEIFTNLDNFYSENQKQMADAAKLVNLQVKIDSLLLDKKAGKDVDMELIKSLKEDYEYLRTRNGIKQVYGIEWVKNGADTHAFKGTLHDFILQRGKELDVDPGLSKDLAQNSFEGAPLGFFQTIDNGIDLAINSIDAFAFSAWKYTCYMGLGVATLVAAPFALVAWPFTGNFGTAIGAVMAVPVFAVMSIVDLSIEVKDFFTHSVTTEEIKSRTAFRAEAVEFMGKEDSARGKSVPNESLAPLLDQHARKSEKEPEKEPSSTHSSITSEEAAHTSYIGKHLRHRSDRAGSSHELGIGDVIGPNKSHVAAESQRESAYTGAARGS